MGFILPLSEVPFAERLHAKPADPEWKVLVKAKPLSPSCPWAIATVGDLRDLRLTATGNPTIPDRVDSANVDSCTERLIRLCVPSLEKVDGGAEDQTKSALGFELSGSISTRLD
jgi:hypothetical protein